MGSKIFDGVWFAAYSHDHPPPHVHGQYADVQVIVELLPDGSVQQSDRRDAILPSNTKRSDVRHILEVAIANGASCWRSGRRHMANGIVSTTDEEIDAALERAKAFDSFPRIVEAMYRPEPGLEFLMLRLSDGRRLLIPREELGELKNATPEQASDLGIGPNGVDIWWPQLDDGLYLPDFLEYRWGKERRGVAA